MATYVINPDGSVTEKKKKKTTYVIGSDGSVTIKGVTPQQVLKEQVPQAQPVQGSGWLQSGAFRDGVTLENTTKAVLGTTTDVSQDASVGFLSIFEEGMDAAIAGFGKLLDWAGFGDARIFPMGADRTGKPRKFGATITQRAEELIAEEMIDEKAIVESVTPYTPLGWANNALGVDVEKDSVLAEKADALAGSVGHMAGTAVAAAVGIPAPVVTIITSFGSEVENAIKNGDATLDQAIASGLVSAGAEALTEQLFSGINIGKLPTADKAITTAISRGISKKTLRTLAKLGVDLAGEGAEEVISGVLSAIGQKLTYAKEADWNELFSSEAAWDSFVSGALMGAGGNLVGTVKSAINKTDYTTGLTKNEQAVVDQVYKDRVAEEQKTKELTQLQKNEIYEQVVKDMDDGRITTDEIEKVLSKEELSKYKALSEEADEYAKLYDTEAGKMSQKQTDRLKELTAKNSELSYEKRLEQARQKITKDTAQKVSGDRLNESYLERDRKNVAYTNDAAKYKGEFARKTVQSAIDSKVLNNTRYSHRFVDLLAKIAEDRGVAFDFTNNKKLKETGMALEGVTVNGFLGENGITINANSSKALNSVVGHEVTHVLEGTDMYQPLEDIVFEYAKATNQYDKRMQELRSLYEGKKGYETDLEAKLKKELVADLVGDYIFTDEKFVESLFTKNRSLWDKVKHEVDYLFRVATAGSEEARKIEKAKKVFEKVYESKTKKPTGEGGVQYSLGEITDDTGKSYGIGVHLDSTLLDGLSADERVDIVKEYIKEIGGETFTAYDTNGHAIDVSIAKHGEKFKNKNGHRVLATKDLANKGIKNEVKQEAIALVDELITAAEYDASAKPNYPHGWVDGYGKNDWEYWTAYIQDKSGNIWEATLNIANAADGRKILYDIGPIKNAGRAIELAAIPANNSVAQSASAVNPQNAEITDAQNEKGLDREQEATFSLSRNSEYMDNAIAFNNKGGHAAPIALADAQEVRGRVADRMNEIKAKGLVALPEDIEGNTAFANSSYDVSEENTTICPRSLASEAFVDAVSEYLGRPLSVEEQIYISQDLQGRSLTPECTYCYVATDRKAYRAFLGEYISQRDNVIQKLKENPDADVSRKGDLYKEFLNGRKDTNPMYSRFKMWVDSYKNGTPMVEASHLANMNKLMGDINSEFGAELKPQIVDAMKYAQSASWAKKRVNYVAYNGHILKWKQDRINKLNSHYGLRMYSFSGFHPAFVLENMQMITDASVRGLKMLGYTKDTDFVDIFAPSGMNINVSTFGFEAGGNVYENNLIGAEWEKAKELRAKYPNVGITFVATNDTLVKWALKQDWIDVVIPYHLVRTGTEVAKAFGYTNYTGESSDAKTGEWKKGDKKYIAPTEHNNDLNTYLEALNKNHLRPRFQRFLDDPDTRPYYMKLVNECRQSAAQSQPVQPIFNEDAAMKALAKLEANGYYQPVGGSVDRMYEIAAEVAENMTNPVQASLSAEGDTTPTNGWNIRGEDVAFVNSTEDLAPIGPNAKRVYTPDPNDLAPLPEKKLPANYLKPNAVDTEETGDVASIEKLSEQYGTLPQGENPVRDDTLPKSTTGEDKVSRTARTVKGAAATPDELVDLLDKTVAQGKLSYMPITNTDTVNRVYKEIVNDGWEDSLKNWEKDVERGKVSADLSAKGALLLNNAAKAGDTDTWREILFHYQMMGTNAGQAVQAMRILKSLEPDDKLWMIRRSIKQMVDDMKIKTPIEIDPELERQYTEATDETEREAARRKIVKQVAKQIPATLGEKWNALRYVNMLGNTRTQLRNIFGNVGMKITSSLKNSVATGIENVAYYLSGGKFKRTKSFSVSKEMKAAARADFANMEALALSGGKYSDNSAQSLQFAQDVQNERQIFKNKFMEKYRTITNKAMEKGDLFFSERAYARALAGYLKAQGITTTDFSQIDPTILDEARTYAIAQAQEQTFRDSNWLADWVSKAGRRNDTPGIGEALAEGIVPFRKTPANVLLRATEYSPLGIVNSIAKSVHKIAGNTDLVNDRGRAGDFARSGQSISGAQIVDSWAKSLTGTGLFGLGMLLSNLGLISGGPDEDEDKDYFESQYGWQNYAVTLPDGTNFTIDFLAPSAMPLLMGVQLMETMQDGEIELKEIGDALLSIADPMIQMSMLQGVNDTLANIQFAENNLGQFVINAALSYLTQGLTNSTLGQLERTFEGKRMTTYVDKDGILPDWLQRAVGKASAKIPVLDYHQIPYINPWGEEETTDPLSAGLENMFSPAYIEHGKTDAVYIELNRLNDAQSDVNVYPSTPDKTVTFTDKDGVKHEKYNLSAEEYVELAKTQGITQKALVEELIGSAEYQNLNDTEKAKAIQNAYTYARELARIEVLGADGFASKWMEETEPEELTNALMAHTSDERLYAYENPGKYAVSQAVGGFDVFRNAGKAISEMTSDKKKVVAYINDLDMDYGQKILLYRSEYTTDDRYNRDIVEYLNSRDDISAAEMRTILEALNFKVSEDGKISW